MRLLLILIASTFIFSYQAYSNEIARPVSLLSEKVAVKNLGEEPIDYSIANEYDAIVSSSHFRRNSTTQYSSFVFSYLVKTPGSTNTLVKQEYFTRSYLHPIPIGLKLLFPQHYFW